MWIRAQETWIRAALCYQFLAVFGKVTAEALDVKKQAPPFRRGHASRGLRAACFQAAPQEAAAR